MPFNFGWHFFWNSEGWLTDMRSEETRVGIRGPGDIKLHSVMMHLTREDYSIKVEEQVDVAPVAGVEFGKILLTGHILRNAPAQLHFEGQCSGQVAGAGADGLLDAVVEGSGRERREQSRSPRPARAGRIPHTPESPVC
jgi:hypothetical protein